MMVERSTAYKALARVPRHGQERHGTSDIVGKIIPAITLSPTRA